VIYFDWKDLSINLKISGWADPAHAGVGAEPAQIAAPFIRAGW